MLALEDTALPKSRLMPSVALSERGSASILRSLKPENIAARKTVIGCQTAAHGA